MLGIQGWQRPAIGIGAGTLIGTMAAKQVAGDDTPAISPAGAVGAVGGAAAAGALLLAHQARSVTIVAQLGEQADLSTIRTMARALVPMLSA